MKANVTAYVGSTLNTPGGDLFFLWNYWHRKLIIIEVIGLRVTDIPEPHAIVKARWLAKIHPLIDSLDFTSETIWAYLVESASGPRIIQKPRELHRIDCDISWAPRIDVRDIEVNSMWNNWKGYASAIWRGKPVTFHFGCNDLLLSKIIANEITKLQAVRDLDITFPLLATVFIGDLLVGYLTESMSYSRTLKASDRPVVYAAVAKLERSFFVHQWLMEQQSILIDEHGRVRMCSVYCIEHYAEDQRTEFAADAQKFHWDRLRKLFHELGDMHHPYFPDDCPGASVVLAGTPPPEFPLTYTFTFPRHVVELLAKDSRRRERSKSTQRSSNSLVVGSHKALKPNRDRSKLLRGLREDEPDALRHYREFSENHYRDSEESTASIVEL